MRIVSRHPDKGYLDANVWIPKSKINVEGVKNALSFSIQERGSEGTLFLYKDMPNHVVVPREFWASVDKDFEVIDCRPQSYEYVDIKSRIKLDAREPGEDTQRRALDSLLSARGGVLQLACGKGKTVIALETISRLHVPCLIAVDTTVLYKQWYDEIFKHLCVTKEQVGTFQGNVSDWRKPIVLATYQTLAARADKLPEEFRRYFGAFFGDEGHHGSAPLFCKCANMFYGRRYFLTATPKREDGLHVVCDLHIGPVLYKNLTQQLKPTIIFKWTGFTLDTDNQEVYADTHDTTGEVHLGKLASHFGRWDARLDYVVALTRQLYAQGRKVLVLSNSVQELANLYHKWNRRTDPMFHEIPLPTPEDVGEDPHDNPMEMEPAAMAKCMGQLRQLEATAKSHVIGIDELEKVRARISIIKHKLRGHYVAQKLHAELSRRQKAYVVSMLNDPSDAGLMSQMAGKYNREIAIKKRVTFAITKYGREGLDAPDLDSVITCEPISSQANIQQFMGRVLRVRPGKPSPLVIFLEDDIGIIHGMCHKIRNTLKHWSAEDGGPYKYILEGFPQKQNVPRV